MRTLAPEFRPMLRLLSATLVLLAASAPSLFAQARPAAGVVISTLGLGGELTWRVDRTFAIRGGYHLFSFSRESTIEEVRYEITPRLRNGAVMLDVHPFGNGFRLSTGALFNRSRADGRAVLAGPVSLGGQMWQPEEVGQLTGRGGWERDVMPYFGLGLWSGGRVAVGLDLGVGLAGYPVVRLTLDSPLSGPEREALDESVAREMVEINEAIRSRGWARYYPVVGLGVRVRL